MALANHSKYYLFLRMPLSAQSYMTFAKNTVQRFRFVRHVSIGLLCFALVYAAQGLQASYSYYLNGQPVTNLATPGTNAVVLFFIATDCPISNRYIPEIKDLEKKYTAQHVVFWFVYPNVGESPEAVRRHETNYGIETHVLLDPHHTLVKLTRVSVTPEAAILVPQNNIAEFRTVYHGRIDDRYIQIGQQRPTARQYDLERAIEEVVERRPVQKAGGPAIGCGIIGQP
jgi:hypothetical protein